jgi:hypothetical protein
LLICGFKIFFRVLSGVGCFGRPWLGSKKLLRRTIDQDTGAKTMGEALQTVQKYYQASAYEQPLSSCEAILAIGEPLTYHSPTDNAEQKLKGFFAKAAAVLSTGGQLIFDMISSQGELLNARSWRSEEQ